MQFQSKLCILDREGKILFTFDLVVSKERKMEGLFQNIVKNLFPVIKNFGFPTNPIFFRFEKAEVRCCSGKSITTMLMIESSVPLIKMVEPILLGLISEATDVFEKKFTSKTGVKSYEFKDEISGIIEKFGLEGFELYQKTLLIEAIYANLPQDFCVPLLEKVSAGEDILKELEEIPERWKKKLRDTIEKVNAESLPIWELFSIPLLQV